MGLNQTVQIRPVVVTGATSGVGLASAAALAERGIPVIATGRSQERCAHAREVTATLPGAEFITYVAGDLATLRGMRQTIAAVCSYVRSSPYDGISALINNAVVFSSWYEVTEDGNELQLAVNHLAPFVLTLELMPLLRLAPHGRVVMLGSGSHHRGRLHWPDLHLRRGYRPLVAYQQSKLANLLFAAELNRRLGWASTVRAYVADPGLVNTDIGAKRTTWAAQRVWAWRRRKGRTPEVAAGTPVMLATATEIEPADALYWKDGKPCPTSRRARSASEARRLWQFTEATTGVLLSDSSPTIARRPPDQQPA